MILITSNCKTWLKSIYCLIKLTNDRIINIAIIMLTLWVFCIMQAQIISKQSWKNTVSSDSKNITISDNSVVLLDISPEDVQELVVNENQIIIKLKNGEIITIDNFNFEKSDLVFRTSDSDLFLLDFAKVEYNPIDSIETLLEPGAGVGATILNNWVAATALAAGAIGVGIAVFDEANGSSNSGPGINKQPLIDAINNAKDALEDLTGTEQTKVDNAIKEAETVLNNPDSTQKDINDAANELNDAVKEAQEAQEAKELAEAVEALQDAVDSAKAKLEADSANPKYTQESKDLVLKEIQESQKIIDDYQDPSKQNPSLSDVKQAKDELTSAVDGLTLITDADKELKAAVDALEASIAAAKTKLANEKTTDPFTTASKNALLAEIAKSETLVADYKDPTKTNPQLGAVKTAKVDLDNAAAKLQTQSDYDAENGLQAAIDALESSISLAKVKLLAENQNDPYTQATKDALNAELTKSQALVDNFKDATKPNPALQDVKDAKVALDGAINGLQTESQYAKELDDAIVALEGSIASAEAKLAAETPTNQYTQATKDALNKEITEAKALVADYKDPTKANPTLADTKQAKVELDQAVSNLQTLSDEAAALKNAIEALEGSIADAKAKLAAEKTSDPYTQATKDALNAEITKSENLVANYKDPAKPNPSVAEVEKAKIDLDAASSNLKTVSEQEAADDLLAAVNQLELSIKAAEDKLAKETTSDPYTATSKAALNAEITKSKALVESYRDPAKTDPKLVDVKDAKVALDNATANLKTVSEQEAENNLQNAIDALEKSILAAKDKLAAEKQSDPFTTATKNALTAEIAKSEALVADYKDPNKANPSLTSVQTAKVDLDNAAANLKTVSEQEAENNLQLAIDALEKSIATAEKKLAEEKSSDPYTAATKTALQTELAKSKAIVADYKDPSKADPSVVTVKAANLDLDKAISNLQTVSEQEAAANLDAAIAALEVSIANAKDKLSKESATDPFTKATKDAVTAELVKSEALVADYKDSSKPNPVLQDVKDAKVALDGAVANLQTESEYAQELADAITALEGSIASAEAKLATESPTNQFTQATKDALNKEIAEAKALVADYKDPAKANPSLADTKQAKVELDQAVLDLKTLSDEALALKNAIDALEASIVLANKKLADENASDPYTKATKDVLLKEIAEAQAVVADYKDPAKANPTLSTIQTAKVELDDAVSGIKTNSEQQAEDDAAALKAAIENLEALVEQAEQKIADNATARDKYTGDSVDALNKEIADAKAVIDQYNDATKPNPDLNAVVKPATTELQTAIDGLTPVVDLLAVENNEELVVTITPTTEAKPLLIGTQALGFVVAKVGVGGAVDVSVLKANQVLNFDVADNTKAVIDLEAASGGISVGSAFDLLVLKQDEYGVWRVDQEYDDWLKVVLLGGTSKGQITLGEGKYQVLIQSNSGVEVLSGNSLTVKGYNVLNYNIPTEVSGSISGNVLTDVNNDVKVDNHSGQDIYNLSTVISKVKVNGVETALNEKGVTEVQGLYGTLKINFDGSYTYTLYPNTKPALGTVETFSYTLKDSVTGFESSANLNIKLVEEAVDHKVIDQNFVVDLTPEQIPVPEDNVLKAVSQVVVASIGLGIADVDVAKFENAIEINVGEGQLREVGFKAAGGAPIALGATPIALEVYKLNENTGVWELFSKTDNWFTIVGLVVGYGSSSQDINLTLDAGQYKVFTTANTIGLSVIPTVTLTPTTDKVISYNNFADNQSLSGDITVDGLSSYVVKSVNGYEVGTNGLVVEGKYGKLTINADGTYVYSLNKSANINQLEVETFSYQLKDLQTGKLATSTLNIKLDVFSSNDDIKNEINVATEISTREVVEKLGLTSGSTASKSFTITGASKEIAGSQVAVNEKDLTASVTFTVGTTLSINGSGRKMYFKVLDSNGQEVKVGEVPASGSTTSTLTVDGLKPGTYTIELETSGSAYFYGNLNSKQIITEYLPKVATQVEPQKGNIFGNDIGASTVTSIEVKDQIAYTKFGNDKITIKGDHGILEIDNQGNYTYTPTGNSYGEDKFTYVTTSVTGTQDSANLVFSYSQTITGNTSSNTVSSGELNDTYTLGASSDKLIFNLLNAADANGGNGKDTWTDFQTGAVKDVIDVSALLKDQGANSTNIGEYLSVKKVGNDTVISIDRDGKAGDTDAAGKEVAGRYHDTELLVLQNQTVDLLSLLNNNQIIY